MEGIAVEYFPSSFDTGKNEGESGFHLFISDNNEQYVCDSHAHMFHLFKKYIRIRNIIVWYVNSLGRNQ